MLNIPLLDASNEEDIIKIYNLWEDVTFILLREILLFCQFILHNMKV